MSFEEDLINRWTQEMQIQPNDYKEPILDEYAVNIIKLACDTFKQDPYIFILTVEVLEDYINIKNGKNEEIKDALLALSAAIFVTSKYSGGGPDLKISIIQKFLLKLSGKEYDVRTVLLTEQEILKTLEYKFPLANKIDDFNTFFEKYVREYNLKDNIRNACLEILQIAYIVRKQWFFELKELYATKQKSFQALICSRFYLPAVILMTAFRCTNYQYFFNLEGILNDMHIVTGIHGTHIQTLTEKFLKIIEQPEEDNKK